MLETNNYVWLTGPTFSKPLRWAIWLATSFPGAPCNFTKNEFVNTSQDTDFESKKQRHATTCNIIRFRPRLSTMHVFIVSRLTMEWKNEWKWKASSAAQEKLSDVMRRERERYWFYVSHWRQGYSWRRDNGGKDEHLFYFLKKS